MKLKRHLEELKNKLNHMEKENPVNWLGRWAKSIQVNKIKNKIRDLEKEIKKNNND